MVLAVTAGQSLVSFYKTGGPISMRFLVSCSLLWLEEVLKDSKHLLQLLNFG